MALPAYVPDDQYKPISFEEFLETDWDARVEWVDGQVFTMPPVSFDHDELRRFLELVLDIYVRKHGLGHVYGENIPMRLETRPSGRCPDVHFVRQDRVTIEQGTYLDGPADLAIEIVSPSSRGQDRGDKFYEYEAAGVQEYWLIDPERDQAEFYVRGENGYFKSKYPDDQNRFASSVIDGLWIEVDWLWQRPRPTVLDIARVWGLI